MLKVCLNGSRPRYERVPVTPGQLAVAAAAAVEAGADAIHVHPRGDLSRETLDWDLVSLTLQAIRDATPGTRVGVSTHARIVGDPAARLALVRRWPHAADGGPDFASVNWHEEGALEVAMALRTNGIGVEAGIWSPRTAGAFVATHWPWQVERVLVEAVPGHTPGGYGTWASERILAALGPQPAAVLVHGEEQWAWPVLRLAQRLGHDTRIGLEDTLHDALGRRVETSAELVRLALTDA